MDEPRPKDAAQDHIPVDTSTGMPVLEEIPPAYRTQLQSAMYAIAEALEFPVDRKGRVYDVRYFIPVLAFHLARAGIGPVEGQAVIKPRRVQHGPQVLDGAVEWVPLDAADFIEDELDSITSAEDLQKLSPAARAVAIQELLGGSSDAAQRAASAIPPKPEQWHTQTSIQFD